MFKQPTRSGRGPRTERRLVSPRSFPFEISCEAESLCLFTDRAAAIRVGRLLEAADERTDGAGEGTDVGDIGRERLQRGSARRGCGEEDGLVKIRLVDEDGVEGRIDRRLGQSGREGGRRRSLGQGCDPTIDRRPSSVGGFQSVGVRAGRLAFSRLEARTRAFARSIVLGRVGFSFLLRL